MDRKRRNKLIRGLFTSFGLGTALFILLFFVARTSPVMNTGLMVVMPLFGTIGIMSLINAVALLLFSDIDILMKILAIFDIISIFFIPIGIKILKMPEEKSEPVKVPTIEKSSTSTTNSKTIKAKSSSDSFDGFDF